MEYCLLPEGGRGAKLGGMVKEHVGSKSLLIFASRAATLQCGVGDGGGRRGPCSSPSCCRVCRKRLWFGQGGGSVPHSWALGFPSSDTRLLHGNPTVLWGSSAMNAFCSIWRNTVSCGLLIVLGPLPLQIFKERIYFFLCHFLC